MFFQIKGIICGEISLQTRVVETASVSGGDVTGELDRLHTPPGYSSEREWLEGLIAGMRSHDWIRSDSVRWLCISVRRD